MAKFIEQQLILNTSYFNNNSWFLVLKSKETRGVSEANVVIERDKPKFVTRLSEARNSQVLEEPPINNPLMEYHSFSCFIYLATV